jgi:hypothetical protein
MFCSNDLKSKLISFFNDKDQNKLIGIFYACLLFLNSFAYTFVLNHFIYNISVGICTTWKSALINSIFKKSLKLSNATKNDVTTGEMSNLINVDVPNLTESLLGIVWYWSAPIKFVIILYMLYQYLGVSALIGIYLFIRSDQIYETVLIF